LDKIINLETIIHLIQIINTEMISLFLEMAIILIKIINSEIIILQIHKTLIAMALIQIHIKMIPETLSVKHLSLMIEIMIREIISDSRILLVFKIIIVNFKHLTEIQVKMSDHIFLRIQKTR